MAFYKEFYQRKGNLFTKKVLEIPEERVISKNKGIGRKRIENEVFDEKDAIADNAKMISLLFSTISRMWMAMPDDQKDNVDPQARQLIDFAINEFMSSDTWADKLMGVKGLGLIEELIKRQEKIGKILTEAYNLPSQETTIAKKTEVYKNKLKKSTRRNK